MVGKYQIALLSLQLSKQWDHHTSLQILHVTGRTANATEVIVKSIHVKLLWNE